MLRVLTLSIAATGCGIQRTRRRTISQCPLENQSSFTAHRNLTTEKCIVGSLIHTYPLDVSLCVSKVGGQEHSDLTLGTRLAGLTFWSRWPFVDDGVAILRLHSRQMGVLAELSRLCVPANLSAKGTSSTLRAYSLGEGLLDIFAERFQSHRSKHSDAQRISPDHVLNAWVTTDNLHVGLGGSNVLVLYLRNRVHEEFHEA
jgi:hypothetical protein